MTKPYGYVRADGQGIFIYGEHQFQNTQGAELIPVYTILPQRTWVGLTEDEAFACQGRNYFETYKAIEAKLKEKNT